MLAACQSQTGNILRCLKHISPARTRACLSAILWLMCRAAGERGRHVFKLVVVPHRHRVGKRH